MKKTRHEGDESTVAFRLYMKALYKDEEKPFNFTQFLNNKKTMKDSNVAAVITQLKQRENVGYEKYGVNTDRTDLGILEWLQHLQEELMDGAGYIEKIKKEMLTTERKNS